MYKHEPSIIRNDETINKQSDTQKFTSLPKCVLWVKVVEYYEHNFGILCFFLSWGGSPLFLSLFPKPCSFKWRKHNTAHSFPCGASATLMLLLWLTQARRSPEGEKHTLCTQPPQSLCSNSTSPKGIFAPHGVGPGLSSMSLM